MFNIPIITYHKISNKKEIGLTTVSQSQFDIQMDYLFSSGYQTVLFQDINTGNKLPDKPIILTFDDGYENVYQNAIPILEKYGFKSVIFVVTEFIGEYNSWEAVPFQQKFRHLSGDQVTYLKDQGHEIASHGKFHRYLPALDYPELKDEIEGSKIYLESLLGDTIASFCYPYGRYSEKIKSVVKNAGYQYATTNAKINSGQNNPLSLKRRSIYSTDSLRNFETKVTNHSTFNFSYLSEVLIQKGALASIGINILRPTKSQF